MSDYSIDLYYGGTQGLYDKAPINGIINSNPTQITIKKTLTGIYLAQERFLIAESSEEFDYNSRKDRIKNDVDDAKFNEFVCVDEVSNGRKVHRLFAKEKVEGEGKELFK